MTSQVWMWEDRVINGHVIYLLEEATIKQIALFYIGPAIFLWPRTIREWEKLGQLWWSQVPPHSAGPTVDQRVRTRTIPWDHSLEWLRIHPPMQGLLLLLSRFSRVQLCATP